MAKRFTDTEKYSNHFFRKLPGPYKLFWDYMYHKCDYAGIWIVDFETAQVALGEDMPIDGEKALQLFNKCEQKIIVFKDGQKWFIPSFIEHQYGTLKEEGSKVHKNVIEKLEKDHLYQYITPLKRSSSKNPIPRVKEKDKEKDKEMDKDKDLLLVGGLTFISPEYKDVLYQWLKYKRHRHEVYKDNDSLQVLYKKLLRLSDNDPKKAVEVVEQSIANNWAGLFELNVKNVKSPSKPFTDKEFKIEGGIKYFKQPSGRYMSRTGEFLRD